jgi:hypothetical protein
MNSNLDLSKYFSRKRLSQIVFLFLGAIAIDATIHAAFTSPFEEAGYWWLKLFAAFVAGTYLLEDPENNSILVAALLFAGIISVYYRSLELLLGVGIGGVVPTWYLPRHSPIAFQQNPLQSTALWAATHLSAFAVPAFLLLRIQGYR